MSKDSAETPDSSPGPAGRGKGEGKVNTRIPVGSPAAHKGKGKDKGKAGSKPTADDDEEEEATDDEDPLAIKPTSGRKAHLSRVLEEAGSSETLRRAMEGLPVAGARDPGPHGSESPKNSKDVASTRIPTLLKEDRTARLVYVLCLGSRKSGPQTGRVKAEAALKSSLESGTPIRDLIKKDVVIKNEDLTAIRSVSLLARFAPPPPSGVSKPPKKRKTTPQSEDDVVGEEDEEDDEDDDDDDWEEDEAGRATKARKKHQRRSATVPYEEVAMRLKDLGQAVENDMPMYSADAGWRLLAGALPAEHGLPPVVADTVIAAASANAKMRVSVDRSGKLAVDAAQCELEMTILRDNLPDDRRAVADQLIAFVKNVRCHSATSYTDGRQIITLVDKHTTALAESSARNRRAGEQTADDGAEKRDDTLDALVQASKEDEAQVEEAVGDA